MDPKKLKFLVQELVSHEMLPLKRKISELESTVSSLREGLNSSIASGVEQGNIMKADEQASEMERLDEPHEEITSNLSQVIDPKGNLINLCTRNSLEMPVFKTTRAGPDHEPQFSCTVTIGQQTFYGSQQPTKKLAEKEASKQAVEGLFEAGSGIVRSPLVNSRLVEESAKSQTQTCPITSCRPQNQPVRENVRETDFINQGWMLQVLVDADNSANILPHISNWIKSKPRKLGGRISIDVFCNRHFSGLKPENFTFHFASGMREAADHEMSFFAGKRLYQWKDSKVVVLVISKDSAIENTVEMLKREEILALFESPCQISSQDGVESIFRNLCDTVT
ncbi:hypothetical protein GUITHDRAFT_105286 [Guillardia theta CCMP2712]|uniref:DRBM domain-containing protein n=1 Tax=Guillardia theta (strain CCMP2712) TaxID=905079 RepID=L1JLI4_GUITC|nr:hypothetical protein GUITHDRAFT_105286 [Guillardia theta CCMP2712]EKX49212.1 hypothetical protein GUITHDRAFT_105286 [Guillardia theta CCMP2712]|eukprot:XP_005836192.1 hypothetical protein GUITHDRAFT_105286 [Guillardia theta CCMP2712]